MNLDVLDIDFSKARHVITLIIGNNGTGKTAMMSNFHPFATLGNLESREDMDLILPKLDGRKVVYYTKGDDSYVIEHIYQYVGEKRSRKISSYIQKNGKELNQTGSVTNFISIIETEFQIDINFLKLIRLGPNVQNFIQLSATERKGFISKLLDEVAIYTKDYKYAVERSKLLKNALKLAVGKRDKLNITDTSVLESSIVSKERLLEENRQEKERLIKEFYEYKGSIDADRLEHYDEEMGLVNENLSRIEKEFKSIPQPKYEHVMVIGTSLQSRYNEQLKSLYGKRTQIVSDRARDLTVLEQLIFDKESIEKELDVVNQDAELRDISQYISELEEKTSNYLRQYGTEFPSYSTSEISSYVDKLNIILFQLDDIYELPVNGVDYFKKYYLDNQIMLNDIPKHCQKLERQLSELMAQQTQLQISQMQKKTSKNMAIRFIPKECTSYNHCPYYLELSKEKVSSSNSLGSSQIELDIENTNVAIDILKKIMNISTVFRTITVDWRPDTGIEGFIHAIITGNKTDCVDYQSIAKLRENAEAYEEYSSNVGKLEEYKNKQKLHMLSNNVGNHDKLVEKLTEQSLQIARQRANIVELDKKLEICESEISVLEDKIEDLATLTEYQTRTSELERDRQSYLAQQEELKELHVSKVAYENNLRMFQKSATTCEAMIGRIEDEIYEAKVKLNEFTQLTEEINHIQERFDIVEILKETVSTSKGIPLLYINAYFKSLRAVANDIIADIYDNEFSLGDFIVNDKEFRIPYRTKGAEVRDIRYASQAESSVATLAISFAMLEQFAYQYNIILLDEVDGPMYKQNKERFFAALEGMLQRLHSEQAFIITQSTMFNEYPVNLIITDPTYRSQYDSESDNIIFQR